MGFGHLKIGKEIGNLGTAKGRSLGFIYKWESNQGIQPGAEVMMHCQVLLVATIFSGFFLHMVSHQYTAPETLLRH